MAVRWLRFPLTRLKLPLFVLGGLFLLTSSIVYISQAGDAQVCVSLFDDNQFDADRPEPLYIMDARTGHLMRDPRTTSLTLFGAYSGASKAMVVARPSADDPAQTVLTIRKYSEDYSTWQDTPTAATIPKWGTDVLSWNTVWTADGTRFLHWETASMEVTLYLVSVSGDVLLTRTYPWEEVALPAQGGVMWSHDEEYLAIFSEPYDPSISVHIFDEKTLAAPDEAFEMVQLLGGWSPTDAQFAMLRGVATNETELAIWTPDMVYRTLYKLSGKQVLSRLYWAPDGQRIALYSYTGCEPSDDCVWRWQYDIFSNRGQLLFSSILGNRTDLGNKSGIQDPMRSVGMWSPDGAQFIYLRERSESDANSEGSSFAVDLVSLDVVSGSTDILYRDVTPELFSSLLYIPPRTGFVMLSGAEHPRSSTLVIPYVHDGVAKADLLDVMTGERTLLIEKADEIIQMPAATYGNPNWSFDGKLLFIPYTVHHTDGSHETRLLWSSADGSDLHLVDGLNKAQQIGFFGSEANPYRWLSYFTGTENGYALQSADVVTGEVTTLLTGLPEAQPWTISVQDTDADVLAIRLFHGENRSNVDGSLYLVSRSGTVLHHAVDGVIDYPAWSSDGQHLFYLVGEGTRAFPSTRVMVVARDGHVVSSASLQERRPYSRGWTSCRGGDA
jgi:hypothetical protein